jgi:hypothetical protein
MKKEILSDLCSLENKTRLIKRLTEISKVLLTCGAYSGHNIEVQNANFDRVNVPQWERDIISHAWTMQNRYSHELLKEYDTLIKKIEKELNFSSEKIKEKTPKDILKEKLKDHVDSL